jgi:PAS domain S-box-containing protein
MPEDSRHPGELLLADAAEPFGSRLVAMLADAGYRVERALSIGAVEQLDPARFALVLLNAELPGGDPLAIARRYAEDESLPVVLLGASSDIELKVRGFEIGAIDFVPLPVEGRELLARVKRHLTVSRVRHALQESEARFRSVAESAVDAIISADAEGRIRAWNRAAEAILGWREVEVFGRPLEIIIPERFHEAHQAGIARIVAGEPGRVIGKTVELFAVHRDGHEIPIELSLATWILDDQRFFTGILRDIRERREAEMRFRAVTESAIDAILSVDTLGAIIGWNPSAERIFGYAESEIVGRPVELLIPERFREQHRNGMARVTSGGPSRAIGNTVELAALRSDGSEFPIELSLSKWSVEGQRFYTGIIRDISRRRRDEEQLRTNAEEIAAKHQELQVQHAELRRSKEALGDSLEQVRKLFALVAEALEGQTVGGQFLLERRIARGGFGVVYAARDQKADRAVAVKVLSPPPEGTSESHIERFRREARAALEIDHPNAVRYLEQGVTDAGLPFLVMELLDGETLRSVLIRERVLTVGRTLEIAEAIASCLASVHERGVVHRDITPANIFFHRPTGSPDPVVVKVLDFGLAKPGGLLGGYTVTRRSELLGTPQYLAPERVTSERVDGRTDVYSLAAVLFEAVSGELPHPATDDPWAAIYSRVHRAPRRLASIDAGLPVELDALLARCLEREPSSRPTAVELEREIIRLRSGLDDERAAYRVEPPPAATAPGSGDSTWIGSDDERETEPGSSS